MSEMDDLSDDMVVICTQSLLSRYEGVVDPCRSFPEATSSMSLSVKLKNQVFLNSPAMLRIVALCIKVMPL